MADWQKLWIFSISVTYGTTQGRDEPKEIVATYKSTESDLLLMGAYSRNRMSQLVFGGVTEYMLKHTSIPVLMLHI